MVVVEEQPFLPTCWSDDIRMNALFAPFRPKTSNPESWYSKMAFWGELLKAWCIHKGDAIFTENEARTAFLRGGRRPACLDTLIEEMQREGTAVSPESYSSSLESPNEGWVKWGAKKALRPVGLALSFMASYVVKKGDEVPVADRKLVIPAVVKHQAERLLASFSEESESTGTISELMESTSMQFPNEDAFRVILGYLLQQKLAIKKGHLYKLARDATFKPSPITESEEALWRLRVAVKRLNNSASALEAKGEQALRLAKAALASGDKIAAKAHLRRKHILLDKHSKCLDALDNVKSLAEALKQTESDAQVVDTYRSGVKALKSTMSGKDLSEDAAYSTMDDLKEVLDSCVEIESTISKPVDSFEAEELEQELADLLAGDFGNSNTSPQGGNTSRDRIETRLPEMPAYNVSDKTTDALVPESQISIDTKQLLLDLPDVPGSSDISTVNIHSAKTETKRSKVPIPVTHNDLSRVIKDAEKPKLTPEPQPRHSRPWYPPKDKTLPEQIWKSVDIPPRNDCVDELQRRLQGLRGLPADHEPDLPDLDSEDDEALTNWSPKRPTK